MSFKKTLNIVGFAGFTKNPEERTVNNSTVANVPVGFTIAENENVYAELTFWGNDAKTILEKYKMGDQFYIEGSVSRLSAYVNKQNNAAVNLNISVTGWRCVHKKSSSNGGNNGNNGGYSNNSNYSNNNYQQQNNQQNYQQNNYQQNQQAQQQNQQQWQPQQPAQTNNQTVQQMQQTQQSTVTGGLPFADEDLPF